MGEWDNLFAFRDAALRGDLIAMQDVLARDSSFLAMENPDGLPLPYLAKTYQIQTFAREGPIGKVRGLVGEEPRVVRQPWTAQGWLPLSQAVWGNQLGIVKFLLASGASGDDRIIEGGGTVLQMAAELDRLEIARLLIQGGADPRLAAPGGASPMRNAKSREMKEMLSQDVTEG
jgi:ankyrin repeat protein